MTARVHVRHWKRWLAVGIVAVAAAVVGGPFIFIHFVEGEAPPLTLSSPSPASVASAADGSGRSNAAGDGTWKVSSGSVVGYRVNEVLFGQSHTAVGRTRSITGSIVVSGTTVSKASFTVDMTTVKSDQTRRDEQFNGRIMETGTYPTATFTITEPIELGSIPSEGAQRTAQAKGNLTIHGVTKTVGFKVTGTYTGSSVRVAGSIPITFEDWNIPNPSFGPVTTEDHGALEFSLNFARA